MLVLEVYGLAAEFVALGRVDNMDTAVRLALMELPGLADYVDEWGLEPPPSETLSDCEECDNQECEGETVTPEQRQQIKAVIQEMTAGKLPQWYVQQNSKHDNRMRDLSRQEKAALPPPPVYECADGPYMRISDLPEWAQPALRDWMYGQTAPCIDGVPFGDTAWWHDYQNWLEGGSALD